MNGISWIAALVLLLHVLHSKPAAAARILLSAEDPDTPTPPSVSSTSAENADPPGTHAMVTPTSAENQDPRSLPVVSSPRNPADSATSVNPSPFHLPPDGGPEEQGEERGVPVMVTGEITFMSANITANDFKAKYTTLFERAIMAASNDVFVRVVVLQVTESEGRERLLARTPLQAGCRDIAVKFGGTPGLASHIREAVVLIFTQLVGRLSWPYFKFEAISADVAVPSVVNCTSDLSFSMPEGPCPYMSEGKSICSSCCSGGATSFPTYPNAPDGCGALDARGLSAVVQPYLDAMVTQSGNPAGFTAACDKHGICYGTPGTNRQACDCQQFRDHYSLCGADDKYCKWFAAFVYGGVSFGGEGPFHKAQLETESFALTNCQCALPPEKAEDRSSASPPQEQSNRTRA